MAQAPSLSPPQNGTPAPMAAPVQNSAPMPAAPQAATPAQSPQAQPQGLPPAFGGGGGSLLGRIGSPDGLIARLTGNDTRSIGQQNLKAQYDSLVPRLGPQKAMLAVMNPEAGKILLAQALEAKMPEYGVVRKDQFGNEIYGWKDPKNKSITEYGQQTAPTTASEIPPPPPGVDPKIWREEQSKRVVSDKMPADNKTTSALRNEVQGLPSYKNIAQAAPVYKSMLEAAGRDTRAADVNMIYGMAKIMDPGSVVRESEMTVAQAIATLPQQLQATVTSQLTSTGRLTPEVRAAIMQEAHSRVSAYQSMFEQDAGMYRGIVQRSRMNEADVLPTFGPFDQYKPPTKPNEPVVIDGYKIKAR